MSAIIELNNTHQQPSFVGSGTAAPPSGNVASAIMRSPETSPSLVRRDSSGYGQTVGNGQTTMGVRKRRREDGERVRVTRACDRCKSKKIRCTGTCPCPSCLKVQEACEFNAEYRRGRVPLPEPGHTPETPPSAASQSYQDERKQQAMLSPVSNGQAIMRLGGPGVVGQSPTVRSSRNSPEASQTDQEGHYVGPSSGVSFMLRVQKKLHEKAPHSQNSSIFTFGDAPLPELDPLVLIMPSKPDAKNLLARYFDFAVPTHRFLHRPTVEQWLEEFYETREIMEDTPYAPCRTALIFMTFAQAREYTSDNNVGPSFRYFLAADKQLAAEKGEIRLTSVQARLCQCFYLLSKSRLNHCWSLFGTTAHLVLAMGLHRRRRADSRTDLIDHECRKRVFWCSYSLDKYLSSALGRPRTYHDEDIDQELPTCVNDDDLHSDRFTQTNRVQSIMLAPIAHVKLLRIVSCILRDMYGIKPLSRSDRLDLAATWSSALREWRGDLHKFLDAEFVDSSHLHLLYRRQRNVLNFGYWHALLLVHRPFLLSNFASLTARNQREPNSQEQQETDRNVEECIRAALNIIRLVDELLQGHQMYRAFWFTLYFAFSAVVVLYVYTIQAQNSSVEHNLQIYEIAFKCQKQISTLADPLSLAERYSIVLEELRLEAATHTQLKRAEQHRRLEPAMPQRQEVYGARGNSGEIIQKLDHANRAENNILPSGSQFVGYNAAMPNNVVQEMTGWGQFDSLVASGMGGLESYLTGDGTNSAWNFPFHAGNASM